MYSLEGRYKIYPMSISETWIGGEEVGECKMQNLFLICLIK